MRKCSIYVSSFLFPDIWWPLGMESSKCASSRWGWQWDFRSILSKHFESSNNTTKMIHQTQLSTIICVLKKKYSEVKGESEIERKLYLCSTSRTSVALARWNIERHVCCYSHRIHEQTAEQYSWIASSSHKYKYLQLIQIELVIVGESHQFES